MEIAMRHRIAILWGALMVVGLSGPVAGGPRAFETTVAPFDPSPYVMPTDFPKEYVKNSPVADGKFLPNGAGAGAGQWYDWLLLWLRPWASARQAFDNEAVTFQETVRDDDATFKAAFAKLSADKLSKFNATHNTQVHQALLNFQNLRGKEASQRKTIEAAMARSDAAIEKVQKEDALLSAQSNLEKRASIASTKAALEKEIAESKAIADKFSSALGTTVDLATSVANPAEFAMKSFGVVTGLLLNAAIDDHTMELFVLDLRLDELDQAIQLNQKTAAEASLREAKKLVDAAALDFVKAILDEQMIIDQETQQLDILASLERGAKATSDPNVPDIFQTLRTLHYDVMLSGKALRKSCARYQSVLNFGPGKRAAATSSDLDKLIVEARAYTIADKDSWMITAARSQRYIAKQADWYPKELKYVAGQSTALKNRVDALLTDAFVQQILSKL
jgi:hypothetical protein